MSRISAVLFDVDGTLVDTNYLHTVTWWEAFRQYGHHVPMAHIHRSIGMGSEALYAPYWPRLRAFDGAAGLLRACADRGLRVVLASSAGEREMRALRNALDAEDVVVTATSAPTRRGASRRRTSWRSRWSATKRLPMRQS